MEKRGLTGRRKKRSNEESTNSGIPCGLNHSEILDFARSRNANLPCYVAAEFFSVSDGQPFVVGDNKTYGGYYNGPLEKDTNYYIWFGIVVTVDGVSITITEHFLNALISFNQVNYQPRVKSRRFPFLFFSYSALVDPHFHSG